MWTAKLSFDRGVSFIVCRWHSCFLWGFPRLNGSSWLPMWFKALLRLKINLDQSELMIPTSRVNHVEELVLELGCKEDKLPATYLGLPLVAPFRSVAAWDGVEERFRKRLSMWKRQYISKGGRLTLINSTLSSFSIYFVFIQYSEESQIEVGESSKRFPKEERVGGKMHLVMSSMGCV